MRATVVGTGYVGLVTGACLASRGHRVTCVDVDSKRVEALRRGVVPFHEPGLPELVASGLEQGRLEVTTEVGPSTAVDDVIMIAVGTPDGPDGADLSFVERAAEDVGAVLRDQDSYAVVAVKSTVVPGTTAGLVRQTLERASGKRAGDFGLCMNPEFLREGTAVQDFMDPDRIVVGRWDERSGRTLDGLYESFDCPRLFTTLTNAELVKYASNALLATLISFSNEVAAVCEVHPGADAEVVMDGVHLDRRLSVEVDGRRLSPGILSYLRAGCGFGGSCLPKDVNALRAQGAALGYPTELLDAVMSVNASRPGLVVRLLKDALAPRELEDSAVAVMGVAFKAGTGDLRDSPALPVVEQLVAEGAEVRAFDPLVSRPELREIHPALHLCDTPDEALAGVHAAVLTQERSAFEGWDWPSLLAGMAGAVVVDGRSALRAVDLPAEMRYLPIGKMPEKSLDRVRSG